MDAYTECPVIRTQSFTLRLVRPEDSAALFACYHDKAAVARMNDDNCDFGFYMETPAQMAETVAYWLDFYRRRCFIRFAVVDNAAGQAVGTVEGFGGEVGVLRIDLASAYERAAYLEELLAFAEAQFPALFGNRELVTKAAPQAAERRQALDARGWGYIGAYRGYTDYYKVRLGC